MKRITSRFLALIVLSNLLPGAAHAVVVSIHDLTVSSGQIYGDAVVVPAGATVSIGVRVEDPTARPWNGVGLSYYGYDGALIDFVDGLAVPRLFRSGCFDIPSLGPFCSEHGLANFVTGGSEESNKILTEDVAFPGTSYSGTPRVRGMVMWKHAAPVTGQSGVTDDTGLDGVFEGGDAHVRVTFEAVGDGYTTITIGTGDDLGGILIGDVSTTPNDPVNQATNAEIRLAVPEPGFAFGLAFAIGGLACIGSINRSRIRPARP